MIFRKIPLLIALAILVVPQTARSQETTTQGSATKARLPQHLQLREEEEVLSDEAVYCNAIVDPAREMRYSAKEEELLAMQKELERGLAMLEEKKASFEKWVKRRDDFANSASDSLIAIYQQMRPDAAAERLTIVDPMLSSAILMKMPPAKSGTILNEMDAKKAAGITAIMAASADRKQGT